MFSLSQQTFIKCILGDQNLATISYIIYLAILFVLP